MKNCKQKLQRNKRQGEEEQRARKGRYRICKIMCVTSWAKVINIYDLLSGQITHSHTQIRTPTHIFIHEMIPFLALLRRKKKRKNKRKKIFFAFLLYHPALVCILLVYRLVLFVNFLKSLITSIDK